MATNVVMPKMGESITEGTILRWLKKEGDAVQKDEPILEISTDKVDTEVPSPVDGVLLKILAQEKQTISVGEPIASIGANGEVASAVRGAVPAPTPVKEETQTTQATQPAPQTAIAQPAVGQKATQPATSQLSAAGAAVVMRK